MDHVKIRFPDDLIAIEAEIPDILPILQSRPADLPVGWRTDALQPDMYIRSVKKTPNPKNGAVYTAHQLVESHRTEKGPRQRMIMHLEALELPRMRWRELAVALEAAITGQPLPCPIAADIQAVAAADMAQHGVKDALRHAEVDRRGPAGHALVPVDLESASNSLVRSLGCELVGHAFYQRLGLPVLMAARELDAHQRDLAEAVILGRLIVPGSDLGTWHWLRARTSLPEFLDSDLEHAGKDAVYEIADQLWLHHKALEAGLREREGEPGRDPGESTIPNW